MLEKDVAIIKGMLLRGDLQQNIAAWFGGEYNSGRVSEIRTGKRYRHVAAATKNLPPPGPYHVSARDHLRMRETLIAMRELINQLLDDEA
jgi:hypothetical protein